MPFSPSLVTDEGLPGRLVSLDITCIGVGYGYLCSVGDTDNYSRNFPINTEGNNISNTDNNNTFLVSLSSMEYSVPSALDVGHPNCPSLGTSKSNINISQL